MIDKKPIKKSPSAKLKFMIDAFERNVKKKNIEKVESFEIMNVDEKQIRKSDENETIVMKNAFENC